LAASDWRPANVAQPRKTLDWRRRRFDQLQIIQDSLTPKQRALMVCTESRRLLRAPGDVDHDDHQDGGKAMRVNLPVSQREYPLNDDDTLLSVTDLKGRIRFANEAFIRVSGFTREELYGKAHNIVRHPDMPPQAFEDMWRTIQAGRTWTALVKNRRKDGDHYWVRANATPVRQAGEVVGYMSVRTKPTADEVRVNEALYRRLIGGQARGLAIRGGFVVHTGWARVLDWARFMPLSVRVSLGPVGAAGCGALLCITSNPAAWPFALAVLAAGGCFAGWLVATVAAPVSQVLGQARQIASGQRARSLMLDRGDEIGALMRSVEQAGLNTASLCADVDAQCGHVTRAAGDLHSATKDLSARTEAAASNLQQTAASMEQLAAAVATNRDASVKSAATAGEAMEVARRGKQMVDEVVRTMHDIGVSAARVSEITALIDNIAFQTNILALNASVEAARAGESGRGFAVVATEVRSLSQRSAEAARQIRELLTASADLAGSGSRAAARAGDAMAEILAAVQATATLIREIAAASEQQTSAIHETNAAVSALDRMTQQNASMVEQADSATAMLTGLTGRLAEAAQAFSS
jgi:aerotaxis receptor